jgi:hypothetical protein
VQRRGPSLVAHQPAPAVEPPLEGGDPDDPDTAVHDERIRQVLTLLLQL